MTNFLLYDETTFYRRFLEDLSHCTNEVIIESPYITSNRTKLFYPVFEKLLSRGVKIYIITKDLTDLEVSLRIQSAEEIKRFEVMGVQPLLCVGNHHRKLAILDRNVLWEGSLNILSQAHSREIMRRIEGKDFAMQMFDFLKLGKVL